ncbi:hypothetical protein A2U01_0096072, partial [Trifolium medium]|nr:hypothetical protein [Trifolium medium]
IRRLSSIRSQTSVALPSLLSSIRSAAFSPSSSKSFIFKM